jgi:hypothetical protein
MLKIRSSAAPSDHETEAEPDAELEQQPEPANGAVANDTSTPDNPNEVHQQAAPSQEANDDENEDEPADDPPSPPRTPQLNRTRTPYLQSPSAEKRKRMELLAQSRKKRATDW